LGVLIKYWGRVNSFLLNFSGYPVGQSIWVGQSGDLVTTPPTGSGMPQQIIGMVTDGSGMFVGNLCAGITGSGQIQQYQLASGVGGGGAPSFTTSYVAGETLSGGEFVRLSGNSIIVRAGASGGWDSTNVMGINMTSAVSGASVSVETLCGRAVSGTQLETAISGMLAGRTIYLSATVLGAATTVPPSASGQFQKILGMVSDTSLYLSGTDLASSRLSVVFQPGLCVQIGV
jgi:hypothetical protein